MAHIMSAEHRYGVDVDHVTALLVEGDRTMTVSRRGNESISAPCEALSPEDIEIRVLDYRERVMSAGSNATVAIYVECESDSEQFWVIGINPSILRAPLSEVVRALRRAPPRRGGLVAMPA
jgi:hypothetical protein